MLNKIKQVLKDACIIFTVFTFIVSAISAFANKNIGIVPIKVTAVIFLCAVLLRAYHSILHYEKFKLIWRVVINFVLVAGTAYIVISFTVNTIRKMIPKTTQAAATTCEIFSGPIIKLSVRTLSMKKRPTPYQMMYCKAV